MRGRHRRILHHSRRGLDGPTIACPNEISEEQSERNQPGMSNGLSPAAAPLCSVRLGRICSARCCVISLMGVDERMAESRKLAAQAVIADGIAPPCASRTIISGIA